MASSRTACSPRAQVGQECCASCPPNGCWQMGQSGKSTSAGGGRGGFALESYALLAQAIPDLGVDPATEPSL
eukprot:10036178-Lingulodinium_polyedra.AAC.1